MNTSPVEEAEMKPQAAKAEHIGQKARDADAAEQLQVKQAVEQSQAA